MNVPLLVPLVITRDPPRRRSRSPTRGVTSRDASFGLNKLGIYNGPKRMIGEGTHVEGSLQEYPVIPSEKKHELGLVIA